MNWLRRILGGSSIRVADTHSGLRPTSLSNPLVIRGPRLGLLNLLGASAAALVAQDRAALSSLFVSVEEGVDTPPPCDVLLLYCSVGNDGRISGSARGLRDLIHSARAPIAIIASPNDPDAYMAASKRDGRCYANLVMTLDRKGGAFAEFFTKLFGSMLNGTTMPMAWVTIAPQIPGEKHAGCPESIFVCEAGHIAFARV
jgi:hypothetical protein